MSVQGRIVTAAAALILVAGIGATGTLAANAATRSCGHSCANFFSAAFGTFKHPAFVLDVQGQAQRAGQPVVLARAGGGNPGEDFVASAQGPVRAFVAAGLLAPGLAAPYGKLTATEIEYAPDGASTGLCLGVSASPSFFTPVTLRPCGVNAGTIWIFDPVKTRTGSYDVLISGITGRNFQNPETLTALVPNIQVFIAPLASLRPALPNQLWGSTRGVLPAR